MNRKVISVMMVLLILAGIVAGCTDEKDAEKEGEIKNVVTLEPIKVPDNFFGIDDFDISEEDFLKEKPGIGEPVKSDMTLADGTEILVYNEKISDEVNYSYYFANGKSVGLSAGYSILQPDGEVVTDQMYRNFQTSIDAFKAAIIDRYDVTSDFNGTENVYTGDMSEEGRTPLITGDWKVGNDLIGISATTKTQGTCGRILLMYYDEAIVDIM